jgi:hypothetical protein
VSLPRFLAALRAPQGAGAPVASGGGTVGQPLSCSQGGWAADLVGAFLYRAPRTFAFEWLRDGAEIPAATMPAHTPTEPGSYACRVTAANQAGAAAQTSAALQVADFSFGRLKRNTNKGIAQLQVLLPASGQISYRGQGERGAGRSRARRSRDVAHAGGAWLKIKPGRFGKRSKSVRRQLKKGSGRVTVKVFVSYVPTGGTAVTKPRQLKLVRK